MGQSRLTIAFVTNNYTPYSGGVVSSIRAYTQALEHLGHTVTIITLDFRGTRKENNVIRVWCPLQFCYKYGPIAVPWQATQEIEQIFKHLKPDIVHIHHPFLLGYAALVLCKKYAIPSVFTNHTQYDSCLHYVPFPASILRPLVRYRLKNFCQSIDHIIAPSSFVQKRLQEQEITSPISMLPSPILPIFEKNMPQFVPKQHNEKVDLLYVGRFTTEKNIYALIQLIQKLPADHFRLTIAGYGYLEQQLKAYAYEKLKLKHEHVSFITNPDKPELCTLYRTSDLFVFASTTETNPLVLAEALSCGTPVVALKNAWHSDQIIDDVNGFWAENLEHMQKLILTIAHDRALFEKLQYGAWQASKYFHAENLGKELEKIYYHTIAIKLDRTNGVHCRCS